MAKATKKRATSDPRNNAEGTPKKEMPEGVRFQPGNPGRPKGARNKLGEAFLEAMLTDWEDNGAAAIAKCRETKPEVYVKVVASILPKELNIKVSELDDLSDEELDRRIRGLAKALSIEIGAGEASGGAEEAAGSQSASKLSSVH